MTVPVWDTLEEECVPKGLKITIAVVLILAGLGTTTALALKDLSRRPDYCGNCHAPEYSVETWISSDYLAYKHALGAVSCQRCHERTPGEMLREIVLTIRGEDHLPKEQYRFSSQNCIRCHADYRDMAGRTHNLARDPHASPHETLDCQACHKIHEDSEDYCGGCHSPTIKDKGWVTPQ